MNGSEEASLGLLTFLSFGISVIAAVLAIDMYKLLRTGEFGKPWRFLIIASVMLTLLQVLKMAEVLNWHGLEEAHLGEIVQLCFVMTLAYAFYRQRNIFTSEFKAGNTLETEDEDDTIYEEVIDDSGWQAGITEENFPEPLVETPAAPHPR